MNSKFSITYTDGTLFHGNGVPKSDWKKIPNRPIFQFVYQLNNVLFIFKGFKRYLHLIKKQWTQGFGSQAYEIFLFARREHDVLKVRIDLKTGKIYEQIVPIGQEYEGMVFKDWRTGVNSEFPYYEKRKINKKLLD